MRRTMVSQVPSLCTPPPPRGQILGEGWEAGLLRAHGGISCVRGWPGFCSVSGKLGAAGSWGELTAKS